MPILLGALVVFFLFISVRLLLNARPETLSLIFKSVLSAIVIVGIVLLILSGRFVNVIVGLSALIPLLPTLRNFFRKNRLQKKETTSNPSFTSMTVAQAREILEVSEQANKKEIKDAHRRLIQKIHPDQGGSDYLAAQVNRAKEILLEHTDSK